MAKIRADKSADERYPAAMLRLRRLIVDLPDAPLDAQLRLFLERAVLSKWDGNEPERMRVNLLTLHSTKGLEFSRVYIVGVEDAQLLTALANDGTQAGGDRRGAAAAVRRHDAHERPARADESRGRGGKPTRGHQFLDEMGLSPRVATEPA